MGNAQENILFISLLLFGNLITVCSEKWSYFNTGCVTTSGRIAYLSHLHLSHCTAECNVNAKCTVFGYSSTDKLCFMFDESFSTANTHSCLSKPIRFYQMHNNGLLTTDSSKLQVTTTTESVTNTNVPVTTTTVHIANTTVPVTTTTVPVTTTNVPVTTTTVPVTTISTSMTVGSCGNATNYTYVASFNKCIRYYSSDRLYWDNARQVCEQDGGHLVYVKTKALLDYISSFMDSGNTKYWIGGKQSQVGSKTFEWLNGEIIDNTTGGQLWLETRPLIENPADNYCLEAKSPSDKTQFGFYDRECERVRRFFCEVDVL